MPESRILEIPPEHRSPEQRDVVDAVLGGRGRVPTPFAVWLHQPALAALWAPLGTYFAKGSSLSAREAEIAVTLIAQHWSGDFVFEAHLRRASELGCSRDIIDAIRTRAVPNFTDPRERAVYDLTVSAGLRESPSNRIFDDAVAALGRDGVADLIALLGYFTAVSLAMKFHNVPVPAR